MKDYEWHRSSYCASGACVEVTANSTGNILVRDSKLGDNSPVLVFTTGGWARVLDDLRGCRLPDGVELARTSGVRWSGLEFDAREWAAFVEGALAGEVDYDELCTRGVEAGPGGDGSGQAATGAGAIAVPPVPVAANPCTCPPPTAGGVVGVNRGHLLGCPELAGDVAAPVAAQPRTTTCGRCHPAERCSCQDSPVPVAAQPRYVLDAPAIFELVERYGEAERDAADSFMRPAQKMAARDEADNLLRAIRVALTPVPASEPIGYTDRGFPIYADFIDEYGSQVRIQHSSAALGNRCWIFIDSEDNSAGLHASPDQVRIIRDALSAWLNAHEPTSQPAWGSGPLVKHVTETPAEPQMPYLTGQPVSFVDDGDGRAARS